MNRTLGNGEASGNRARRALVRAFKILVSAGIVALLFRRVPVDEVMGALRLARGGPIVLSCSGSPDARFPPP